MSLKPEADHLPKRLEVEFIIGWKTLDFAFEAAVAIALAFRITMCSLTATLAAIGRDVQKFVDSHRYSSLYFLTSSR